MKNTKKRMRLPNGFGQITEIKNANLRKPFRAMVTVGKNEQGRPICKLLKPVSYFKTYNEAYIALLEYNKNPYDLDSLITMEELYKKWSVKHYEKLQKSSIATLKTAWKYCHPLYSLTVREIRIRHLKECIDNTYIIVKGEERKPTSIIKQRIKTLFNYMFDYAVEYELTDKNYSRAFKLSDEIYKDYITPKNNHFSFSDEEMKILWNNLYTIPFVDIILIQCYSGWRPGEMGLIKRSDYDRTLDVIVGGIKTSNGKNRIVPVHPKIKPIIEKHYQKSVELNSEWLFNNTHISYYKKDGFLSYERFKRSFYIVIDTLNLDKKHKPHDGRKHFVTIAKKYNVDEYAIKYLVGHSISDITERVYTDREIQWLKDEINKIL